MFVYCRADNYVNRFSTSDHGKYQPWFTTAKGARDLIVIVDVKCTARGLAPGCRAASEQSQG
jgi:hypothetical protein